MHSTPSNSEARIADESARYATPHGPASGASDVSHLPSDAPSPASVQATAWSQDWLQRVYAHCASLPTCQNEFGTAWRYRVPEPRRSDKRVGMCLCRMYASQLR